jgi:hypothetical protein|tara:strand:- start:288 stop:404 length:117 start_codon:yes stop_codon:yes gene_type:complete
MKKIVTFGKRKFICELKKVAVRGGKFTEKVFCKEVKKK